MASPKLSLKLLIDVKAQKVVFAEAEKDFVDFLFYLLSLPVGTISGLLNQGMVGCMGNLYQSVKTLNINYVQSNISKDSLLKPGAPTSVAKIPRLFPDNSTLAPTKFYSCLSCHRYVSNVTNAVCPNCSKYMLNDVTCVPPNFIGEGGYVKGLVTYMVTDDLSVMPMSMISGISIMNNSNISGFDALEQKKVEFGMDEALKLLTASLQTKEALTCVFLSQKCVKNVTAAK